MLAKRVLGKYRHYIVCWFVTAGQTKRVEQFRVFITTATWSIWAHVWMYLVYEKISPNVSARVRPISVMYKLGYAHAYAGLGIRRMGGPADVYCLGLLNISMFSLFYIWSCARTTRFGAQICSCSRFDLCSVYVCSIQGLGSGARPLCTQRAHPVPCSEQLAQPSPVFTIVVAQLTQGSDTLC